MTKALRGHLGILCMACAVVLSLSSLAAAQPTLPFNPWGTVTIDGSPAPDGSVVEAYVNDTLVATMPGGTVNGYYSIIVPGDDSAASGSLCGIEGAEVTIKVNGNTVLPRLRWTRGSTDRIDLALAPKTLIVNQTSPACTAGDAYFGSIQDAVNLANAGDTVIVCPGTYNERVSVAVPITIRSHAGPAVTVINASGSGDNGINLYASNVTLSGFTITGAGWSRSAVYLQHVEHCTVTNNIITANDYAGIYLALADNNVVLNNTVSSNDEYGIYVGGANNTVQNNSIYNNTDYGMVLPSNARYNSLVDNMISSNAYGIWLFDSYNNTLTTNHIKSNSNYGLWLRNATSNSITSNTINANTVGIYLEDASTANNIEYNNIAENAGYDLYNDQPTSIAAERNWWGTIYCTLIDSRIYADEEGSGPVDYDPILDAPYPEGSPMPCLRLPIVVTPIAAACTPGFAYYPTIQDAVASASSGDTIIVCPGTYNENVLVDVSVEIVSYGGPAVTIVNASNPYEHVFKLRAEETTLRGFGVTGTKPHPFAGISVEGARCTVSDTNAFGGDVGIMLLSSGNRVMNNTASANRYGIWLYNASGNTITNNTIADNALDGMHLEFGSNNFIYRNEFVNNTAHAYSSKSSDTWNSPGKMAYRYASQLWVNYLGNHWDDYTGSDADGDGIGEVSYPIDGDSDSYPLIASPDEYETPAVVCSFDTGAPANPYPSISGMHNGTITPNSAVIVSRLFTYPCPGTGEHTEYAAFYNATGALVAEATWSGYSGDWHNLSFEPPFLLEANETYRYTIRTGSYPQIHHTHVLHAAAGWINCSEFVDPTGKRNDEWIPAIELAWLPTTTDGSAASSRK
jgi:parallel beta-helix repeat protein